MIVKPEFTAAELYAKFPHTKGFYVHHLELQNFFGSDRKLIGVLIKNGEFSKYGSPLYDEVKRDYYELQENGKYVFVGNTPKATEGNQNF